MPPFSACPCKGILALQRGQPQAAVLSNRRSQEAQDPAVPANVLEKFVKETKKRNVRNQLCRQLQAAHSTALEALTVPASTMRQRPSGSSCPAQHVPLLHTTWRLATQTRRPVVENHAAAAALQIWMTLPQIVSKRCVCRTPQLLVLVAWGGRETKKQSRNTSDEKNPDS